MILVLAGTQDGRQLAMTIARAGYDTAVSTISAYGGELARGERLQVLTGALDCTGLINLITSRGLKLVVDASHPFAINASKNAMAACQDTGILYVRYERTTASLPGYDRINSVADAKEAAAIASRLGKTIFLTTGSRTLAIFKKEPLLANNRLIARVLPDPDVMRQCFDLGFLPRDIVALQGPFSHALNVALFREYGADVVITKNSGNVGGCDAKITAAMELNLSIVVINRPRLEYSNVRSSFDAILEFVREELS